MRKSHSLKDLKSIFVGLTWEQRKLSVLGIFNSNGVDKKVNKDDHPVSLLNYMDVYNRTKITNSNRMSLMQVTATCRQLRENDIRANDVFFTPTSESADDIGKVSVIEETLQNTVYSYHLMRYRPHANTFSPTFPNYVFDTPTFKRQLELAAQGVQRFVLNRPAFENLKVKIPLVDEQRKISTFLGSVDDLITLHQCKLFNPNSADRPKSKDYFPESLLFLNQEKSAGISLTWEQRKLGEVSRLKHGYPFSSKTYSDEGGFSVITIGNVTGSRFIDTSMGLNRVLKKPTNIAEHQVLEPEDILISLTGNVGRASLNWGNNNLLNQRVGVLVPASESIVIKEFIFQIVGSSSFQETMTAKGQGAAQLNISNSDIESYPISLPSIKEQEKIGFFFRTHDDLITLHQRELQQKGENHAKGEP